MKYTNILIDIKLGFPSQQTMGDFIRDEALYFIATKAWREFFICILLMTTLLAKVNPPVL